MALEVIDQFHYFVKKAIVLILSEVIIYISLSYPRCNLFLNNTTIQTSTKTSKQQPTIQKIYLFVNPKRQSYGCYRLHKYFIKIQNNKLLLLVIFTTVNILIILFCKDWLLVFFQVFSIFVKLINEIMDCDLLYSLILPFNVLSFLSFKIHFVVLYSIIECFEILFIFINSKYSHSLLPEKYGAVQKVLQKEIH